MSEEEESQLVTSLVRYMLLMDGKKHPIKREDITKHILAQHKGKRGLFDTIMAKATAILKDVFGYEVVILAKDSDRLLSQYSQGKDKVSTGVKARYYTLRLAVAEEDDDTVAEYNKLLAKPEDEALLGLLHVVLSLIHLNDGPLLEEELWLHLNKMALNKGEFHPELGYPEKALETLIKQMYLERIKINEDQPAKIAAGLRVSEEGPEKQDMKEFIENMRGEAMRKERAARREQ